MNITEFMSFDLEWFTTLPGILITSGVVVLLIALIIFVASNKKEKNDVPEVAPVENNDMMSVDNGISYDVPMTDVTSMPIENNFEYNNNNINAMNNVESGVPSMPEVSVPEVTVPESPAVVPNVVDFSTSVQQNVNEVSAELPVSEAPIADTVAPSMPDAIPVESSVPEVAPVAMETPVEIPSIETTPEVAPVVEEKPVIYGGANPASVTPNIEVKPVIYGGANPLENTTTIPTITNQGAYGVLPTVEPEPVAPVVQEPTPVEPVMPVVNEAVPTEPVVQDVAPVVNEPAVVEFKPEIPMTGEEMFASTEANASSADEIETLDF